MGHNVRSRGGNRLKYQVNQAIKMVNQIGDSKKEARKNGTSGIHSYKQIKEVISVSQNFVDWASNQEVKDIYQLKKHHYQGYIEYKSQAGCSIGYLINIETNLRLLDKGMKKLSNAKGYVPRNWIPKRRTYSSKDRAKPENRSIDHLVEAEVYEKLSKNAKPGMLLQLAFGLRLREAAASTTHYIVDEGVMMYWVASENIGSLHPAKGVTKAGRPRKTPCRPEYVGLIRSLLKEREDGEFLVKVKYNTLRSAYNRVGLKVGSHGLRHTYARAMMRCEFEKRGIGLEGSRLIQQMIENKDAGYRCDHLLKKCERALFKQVQEVMDTVHGYLGHGNKRMDLAAVYLTL